MSRTVEVSTELLCRDFDAKRAKSARESGGIFFNVGAQGKENEKNVH